MNAPMEMIEAAIKNGRRYLRNEIPELRIAITSVFAESFEVNHITDRNKKIGNSINPKCQMKL